MTLQCASIPRAAFVAIASLVMCAACSLAGPALFADLKLDEAIAQGKAQGRILVVKGTAEWCGPCKQMDRTTWVDPKVEAWFKDKGLAIAVDVDADPTTAKRLKVRAMPTMIAFKDGAEVDRIVGGRNAAQFLTWLEGLERGQTGVDRAREDAKPREGARVDVEKRLELASALSESGRHAEALEEYLWLWNNMLQHDPGYMGVRVSFMTSEMGQLAQSHEPAREKFTQLRDAIEGRLRSGDAEMSELVDWIALTLDTLDEPERVIAWYERVKDDPEAAASLRRVGHRLQELLINEERYADVGRLMESPSDEARGVLEQRKMVLGMVPADQREFLAGSFADRVAMTYACALAAERDDEGAEVVEAILKDDDSAANRVALIEWALKVGEPRPSHRALLDAAEAKGADVAELRAQLEKALEAKK